MSKLSESPKNNPNMPDKKYGGAKNGDRHQDLQKITNITKDKLDKIVPPAK